MIKQNRFSTLNDALDAEGVLDTWQLHFPALAYGQTFSYTHVDDDPRYGLYISVHRFDDGCYERAIVYRRSLK